VHGKTPEEILSGASSSFTSDLSQYHPFGSPAFVLDARLQGSMNISWWEPRSRVGVYLGHSPHHANNVALILNLSTGHVSRNITWSMMILFRLLLAFGLTESRPIGQTMFCEPQACHR
jgi:hypothetical protein